MAFQAVPNTASFRTRMTYNTGEEILNIFYVRNTLVGWTAVTLAAMAATIGNAYRDQVMPLVCSTVTFDRVDARDEGAQFGAQTVTEYNTVGGDVTECLPANVAALVQYGATSGAPPRRGRLFVGGLTITSIQAGSLLAATYQAGLGTAFETIKTQIEGGANAQVLVSRFLNNAKRVEAATNTIATVGVRQLVASQRDRRPGEGS